MYPDLEITASDLCPNAVFSVRAEMERWGVEGVQVVQSDLFAKLHDMGPFDLIIFNPPWVPRAPEIQPDGSGDVVFGNDYPLDLFDRLFTEAPMALRSGGHLATQLISVLRLVASLFCDMGRVGRLMASHPPPPESSR